MYWGVLWGVKKGMLAGNVMDFAGLGFSVLGCDVSFRGLGLGLWHGSVFCNGDSRVQGLEFGVHGLGVRVLGLGLGF